MNVSKLRKILSKAEGDALVFITVEDKLIDKIGISFDDLGDVEMYEVANEE